MTNKLYYGDNLEVLRSFPDACVDLIYLDPPFNSNAGYNVLFKSASGAGADLSLQSSVGLPRPPAGLRLRTVFT
ncbi:MAG: hypothetical protein H0W39_07555 [Sphingomonas sp.]|nr:hypothetical protein [Sphingomonas sp.]